MRQKFWLILLVLGVLMLTIVPAARLIGIKGAFWHTITGPSRTATAAGHSTRSIIDVIRDIRRLHQENDDLKAENTRLHAQLEHVDEVEHENDLLRKQLGFAEDLRHSYDLVPAAIIGRSPSTYLQDVTIDRGHRDGLVPNQAVMSEGFVVGRITQVTETTSQVQLITASRSLIPVTLTHSRATGILQGGLAGLTGEEFEAGTQIEAGEGIVTSGLGGEIPAGLPVGSVERKLSADSDFVQRVAIHSPIEFSKLELVLVLKQK